MEDNEPLAERIRSAFEMIEAPSRERLLAHRQHRGLGMGARMALLVVAVGALGAFIWLRPGAAPTAQAWSAVPLPEDSQLIARAEAGCGSGTNGAKAPGTGPIDSGLPLAIVDGRVNTAVAFFTDGKRYAACEFSWNGDGSVGSAMSWQGTLASTDASSLDVLTWGSSPEDGQKKNLLFGHVGTGTVRVEIELASGTTVTATVNHGYYLAWWPTAETVVSINASDASGRQAYRLDHPSLP